MVFDPFLNQFPHKKVLTMKLNFQLFLLGSYFADAYLHNPRDSNNRLNEDTANRANNNRLFDSQNNNQGADRIFGLENRRSLNI